MIDNKRARGFQTIVATFRILLSDEDNPAYSAGAASIQSFLKMISLLDDAFKEKARNVLNKFQQIHTNYPKIFQDNNYRHSKRFAPIEFVGVCLLIDRYPERSIGLLSGDIKRMREYLRAERQELRSNTSTFRAVTTYVGNLEQYRGGQGVLGNSDGEDSDDDLFYHNDEDGEVKPEIVNGTAIASQAGPSRSITTYTQVQNPTQAGPSRSTNTRAQATRRRRREDDDDDLSLDLNLGLNLEDRALPTSKRRRS